jgi:hypothetical protein
MKNWQIKLGISMSASWAWGISLVVGHQIIANKGLIPFAIWGIFNISALLVYGLFVLKFKEYLNVNKYKTVSIFMTIIQIFAIWVNIKAMVLYSNIYIGLILAFIVIVLTLRYKLTFSLNSDQWQYLIMTVGCFIFAFVSGFNRPDTKLGSSSDMVFWGIWGGIALVSGPFLDAQHLQRAKIAKSIRPFLIASISFGVYMIGVFVLYLATGNIVKIYITIIVLAVATSTIDSAVASLQMLYKNKYIPILISLIAFGSWYATQSQSIMKIWLTYASIRVYIVIGLILFTIWRHYQHERHR